MTLSKNPTQSEVVKNINDLETKTIKEITSQNIRITDLDTGIYKLTYNGTKYVYYKGENDTSSKFSPGEGEVILLVSKNSSTLWNWHYISGIEGYPLIIYGNTTTSDGCILSKDWTNLIEAPFAGSLEQGRVLMSTSDKSYGLWTKMDETPTQDSTTPITSGGVYNSLIGGWQLQEDRVVSSLVQNVDFTIDLSKYDYRIEMIISAPYNGNFVGSLRNSSGVAYSLATTWVANTVGNGNTWGTYPAMSANNEILLADTNTNDTSNTHSIVLEMSMFPNVNRLTYKADSSIMNGNFHEIKETYGIIDTSTAPVLLRLRASSSTGVTGEFKIYKRSRA